MSLSSLPVTKYCPSGEISIAFIEEVADASSSRIAEPSNVSQYPT
jgi:hypothetical protein